MTDYLDTPDFAPELRAELSNRAMRASQALRTAARDVLGGQRSGMTRSFAGAAYTASAPGEPPAERSGALRESWRPFVSYPVSQHGGDVSVTAGIVSDVFYSALFDPDLPGYVASRIAPRPFVQAILDAAQPEIEAIFSAPLLAGL